MQAKISQIIESKRFISLITYLILLNAVTLGLETSGTVMAAIGPWLKLIDRAILTVFVVELLLRLYVYRWSFFRSWSNVFDFLIVAISLIPASGALSVLRAFRVLRVFRLFTVVPQMRRVIGAMIHALPGMASVVSVLLIVFYVSAVITTKLFGTHPDAQMQILFGDLGASMYTLFQIMTLEGWSDGIVRPALELFPWAWLFFIPFIIITSFAVLNLFIGIIVEAMQAEHKQEQANTQDSALSELKQEIMALRQEIGLLRTNITKP